ncbi:MAG TPA: DUF4349 domain-containing protein [Candidatus Acidoferrum sp.]|nr:DUF4349 domain-containing protein [Candidatus Acidoferrum sp.]
MSTTTTHPVAPEEVMALLDGELAAERAQTVFAHLEQCAECRTLEASLRNTSQSLAAWKPAPVPAGLENHVAISAAKTSGQLGPLHFGETLRPVRWTWKRRVLTFATAGFAFLLLLTISVPSLLRSRMAANEASAVGSLRALNTAAVVYSSTYGHFPRSLKNLGGSTSQRPTEDEAGLVDGALAAGRKSGYLFSYRAFPPDGRGGYSINAYPIAPSSTGFRRFSTDQTGEIFANGQSLGGPVALAAQERSQPINDQLSKVVTLSKPGVAADSNGLYHGLGDHAQNSFSVDGQLAGPLIARAASLSIFVKDFDAGRASLDAILARHNGYAASLTVSAPQAAGRSLQASLRIPALQLVTVVSELKALGCVEAESQNGEEVTQQHADLVARLKNSRETEQRLQDVLRTRTGKVKDVLEVEQEIARVRGETEQMEAEQKNLEHRVEFATIDLKLSEEYKAQLNPPAPSVWMQLHNAGVNGFRNAFESFLGIVLFLMESGPSIVLWLAILGSPAWLLWRRYRRAHALGSLAGA